MARPILGRRIAAGLLDVVVLLVLIVPVGVVFGQAHAGHGSAGVMLHGASVVVWVLLALAYYFFTEASSGQTLGKRVVGVRVTRLDGATPSTAAIALRTVLRVVDFLPAFYLLGLLFVLLGARRQRIGDLVAGTVVTPT
jgi:uncharacterized RDD family membrane protein YckC